MVARKMVDARKKVLAGEIAVGQKFDGVEETAEERIGPKPLKAFRSRLACSAAQCRNARLLFQLVADAVHVSDQRLLAFGVDFAA